MQNVLSIYLKLHAYRIHLNSNFASAETETPGLEFKISRNTLNAKGELKPIFTCDV